MWTISMSWDNYYRILVYLVTRKKTCLSPFQRLYLSYLASLFVKLLINWMAMVSDRFAIHLPYDHLIECLDPSNLLINKYSGLFWALVPLCAIEFHRFLWLTSPPPSMRFFKFIVGTRHRFFELNPRFKFRLTKVSALKANLSRFVRALRGSNRKVKFSDEAQDDMPVRWNASARVETVFLSIAFDCIETTRRAVIVPLGIWACAQYTHRLWFTEHGYGEIGAVWILLDMLGAISLFVVCIRDCIFQDFNLIILAFLCRRFTADQLPLLSKGKGKGAMRFVRQNTALCRYMYQVNCHSSHVLATLITTNLALNVYLTTVIIRRWWRLDLLLQVVNGGFVGIQLLGTLLATMPMAIITKTLYRPDKTLFLTLNHTQTTLPMKFKLAIAYEQLHTRKKVSFTMGPMGKVTTWSHVKFLLMYITFILFTIKFMKMF